MNKFLKLGIVLLILFFIIFSHFYHLGQPAEVVFDEVHFGKFFSSYLKHEYFFDIHPPLGKLIFAATGYVSKFQPTFDFNKIGEPYPDYSFIWMRLIAAIFGILFPILIFLVLRQLKISFWIALLGMVIAGLESAFLVQSRMILMDIFLLDFGLLGFLFYLLSENKSKYRWFKLFLSALFLGLAVSVKWTGLGFFIAVLIYLLVNKGFRDLIKSGIFIFIIILIVYFSLFAVHFYLIKQSIFIDAYKTTGFPLKFYTFGKDTVNLNIQMFKANQSIKDSHPYSSKWYQWPLAYKSIFYWSKDQKGIYLMPNKFIWLLSLFAVFFSIIELTYFAIKKFLRKGLLDDDSYYKLKLVLVGAYLANWLPFIFIGRVMFLYHYFIALIFAMIMLFVTIDGLKKGLPSKLFYAIVIFILGFSIFNFVYYLPKIYGY